MKTSEALWLSMRSVVTDDSISVDLTIEALIALASEYKLLVQMEEVANDDTV